MSVPAERLDVELFDEPPVSGLSDRAAVEQALVSKYPELTRLLIKPFMTFETRNNIGSNIT